MLKDIVHSQMLEFIKYSPVTVLDVLHTQPQSDLFRYGGGYTISEGLSRSETNGIKSYMVDNLNEILSLAHSITDKDFSDLMTDAFSTRKRFSIVDESTRATIPLSTNDKVRLNALYMAIDELFTSNMERMLSDDSDTALIHRMLSFVESSKGKNINLLFNYFSTIAPDLKDEIYIELEDNLKSNLDPKSLEIENHQLAEMVIEAIKH